MNTLLFSFRQNVEFLLEYLTIQNPDSKLNQWDDRRSTCVKSKWCHIMLQQMLASEPFWTHQLNLKVIPWKSLDWIIFMTPCKIMLDVRQHDNSWCYRQGFDSRLWKRPGTILSTRLSHPMSYGHNKLDKELSHNLHTILEPLLESRTNVVFVKVLAP